MRLQDGSGIWCEHKLTFGRVPKLRPSREPTKRNKTANYVHIKLHMVCLALATGCVIPKPTVVGRLIASSAKHMLALCQADDWFEAVPSVFGMREANRTDLHILIHECPSLAEAVVGQPRFQAAPRTRHKLEGGCLQGMTLGFEMWG